MRECVKISHGQSHSVDTLKKKNNNKKREQQWQMMSNCSHTQGNFFHSCLWKAVCSTSAHLSAKYNFKGRMIHKATRHPLLSAGRQAENETRTPEQVVYYYCSEMMFCALLMKTPIATSMAIRAEQLSDLDLTKVLPTHSFTWICSTTKTTKILTGNISWGGSVTRFCSPEDIQMPKIYWAK